MEPPTTYDELALLVAEQIEESVALDFKRQLPDSGKNDDLARDLAAMANTAGGIIIYGIEEDSNGRAACLTPITLKQSAERVSLVARNLDEPVTVTAHTIAAPSTNGEGFLIVVVPRSDRAPHLTKGSAWGRAQKNNYPLSRRQVGELFARSSGFAEEFGITAARPGRLKAYAVKEPRFGSIGSLNHYLALENDGESDITNANWKWPSEEPKGVITHNNRFPLELMHPGALVRIGVSLVSGGEGGDSVQTTWTDGQGKTRQATWPLSWY